MKFSFSKQDSKTPKTKKSKLNKRKENTRDMYIY